MRKARKATPLTQAATILKQAIESQRTDIRSARDRMEMLNKNRISIQLLTAVLFERTKGLHSDAYIGAYYSVPEINFNVYDADGFKAPVIMDTLEFLTREFEDVRTHESDQSLYRSYNFSRNDMRVCFNVFVRSDSETCQLVEIGEETQVIKKYKQVCSG